MTSASANLVCFRWLESQNRLPEEHGFQRVSTYPSKARFRSGDGRVGEVRHASDIPAGVAGNTGKFAAFALDADITAPLRDGAMEALGGQLDSPRDSSVLLKRGLPIPLRVDRAGRYILGVVDFGKDASTRAGNPAASA